MENIYGLVEEIFNKGYVMSLGTVDDSGVWVSDVVYVYTQDFNICWVSQVSTRHSLAIAKNNKVAATITLTQKGGYNEGLQIEGVAEKIDGGNLEMLKEHLAKRDRDVPHKSVYYENGKPVDAELCWYRLKSKKIELINEKYFGFEKKVITID